MSLIKHASINKNATKNKININAPQQRLTLKINNSMKRFPLKVGVTRPILRCQTAVGASADDGPSPRKLGRGQWDVSGQCVGGAQISLWADYASSRRRVNAEFVLRVICVVVLCYRRIISVIPPSRRLWLYS